MILDTAEICNIPHIASAQLTMSTAGDNKLSLTFNAYAPAWAQYMEPVTLIHRGHVIYHGKISAVQNSNDAGQIGASVEVADVISLLNNTTLPEQSAAVHSAKGVFVSAGNRRTLRKVAAKMTFAKLSRVQISASGWAAHGTGTGVALLLSDKLRRRRCLTTRRISGGTTTLKKRLDTLRASNRDLVVTADYQTGNIQLRTLGDGAKLVLDTATQRIYAADGLQPQYENAITSAQLAITDNRGGIMHAAAYPDYMPTGSTGAKVYKITASANVQPAVWDDVARQLYDAANAPTWGGTIRMRADDLDVDPLGRRVCLVGPGMHPNWAEMLALVTGTTWDFMSDTVDMSLGAPDGSNDNSEPTELDDESCNGGEGDDTGDDEPTTTYDDDTTTDDGGGGRDTTTGGPPDLTADTTTGGLPDYTDDDTTSAGDDTTTWTLTPSMEPITTDDGGDKTHTTPTSGTPTGIPPTPTQTPTATPTHGPTHSDDECCPYCRQKIAELTQRITALEARPVYTFSGPYLEVSADHVVQVSEQAMRNTAYLAADQIELQVQVEGLVEQTAFGNLRAVLDYDATSVSPTLDSNITY